MHTVTFAKLYKHRLDDLRTAHYPAGETFEVSSEIAQAARKVGALKGTKNGRRPPQSDGKGDNHSAKS